MKVFFGALTVSFGFLLPNDLLLARPKRRQKLSHSKGEMARSNGDSLQICKFRLYTIFTSETFSTASKFDTAVILFSAVALR